MFATATTAIRGSRASTGVRDIAIGKRLVGLGVALAMAIAMALACTTSNADAYGYGIQGQYVRFSDGSVADVNINCGVDGAFSILRTYSMDVYASSPGILYSTQAWVAPAIGNPARAGTWVTNNWAPWANTRAGGDIVTNAPSKVPSAANPVQFNAVRFQFTKFIGGRWETSSLLFADSFQAQTGLFSQSCLY